MENKKSYSRHDLIQEGMFPSEWDAILDASKAYCKENKLPMSPENLLGHARELVDKWRNNKDAIAQKKEELKENSEDIVTADENTLICIITGDAKKVSDKEKTLQSIARTLSSEYGFDISDMERDYKLSFVDPFSGKKRRLNANIVVFKEGSAHDQENIIRLCIIQDSKVKANDSKNGIKLLEDALGAVEGEQTEENPGCAFGLWTNSSELHFMQKRYELHEPEPIFEELADFPGKDETIDDLDRPDRLILRVAAGDSLLNTFKRCHDYIYGNQGKIKTAFWELLNIIFCKIYDERRREICNKESITYRRKFWVGLKERNTKEGQAKIAKRIKDLFEEVKASPEYKDVFRGNEEITLNDKVLSYIAGEVAKYSFLEASVDVKGMAYESIVSNTLKQERGQFFTPRNIIKLMVQMMDPSESDLVLDPACGSGGFLVMVLDHVRHKIAKELYPDAEGVLLDDYANNDPKVIERAKKYAKDKLFGIDFDDDLKRASRMNMVMSGDGHGNIYNFNSLEYPNGSDEDIQKAISRKISCGEDAIFDYIFTNPPFGAKIPIDDPNILKNFELGHKWNKNEYNEWTRTGTLQSSQPPEILFIERCYQFLKEGGTMAIVLPDGILGNPELEYVRNWILKNTKVIASVDLPIETFLPQVGVQASLLFLQKKTSEERLMSFDQFNYEVFMALVEKVGKDRRGNPVYKKDEDGIELLFIKQFDELRKLPSGEKIVKSLKIHEKDLDDDLPLVLNEWQNFLQEVN